jgi:hypothetical protein
MTHILCIETSTKNCSVSISKNGEILTVKEIAEDNYSHAENLHVFIQKILEESGLEKHQLHAIAVSKGPGSYTGLRIGVSAAKGLCYALDLPLISLPYGAPTVSFLYSCVLLNHSARSRSEARRSSFSLPNSSFFFIIYIPSR